MTNKIVDKIINKYFARHCQLRIVGIIRIRNEELILDDTLNHFSKFVDGIIIYDDASNDKSIEIAKKHAAVIRVIKNNKWEKDREKEETRHRQLLLDYAQLYKPEWIFYSDCDERFDGDIRSFLLSEGSRNVDAIKVSLFDAYITPNDRKPYQEGELYNFRKLFGPERRDIIMIWRNNPEIKFEGLDKREPKISKKANIITKFYCQHYGKSLSIEHWEETCEYYAEHFPKYSEKWNKRHGKSIHKKSDFGRDLLAWDQIKKVQFLD